LAKYAHAIWKHASAQGQYSSPLIPFYATRAINLALLEASSSSRLTAVACYYSFQFGGTVTLDASNKAPYTQLWWQDLAPTWEILQQVPSSPPYPSNWAGNNGETHAVASGGFNLSIYNTPDDNSTGTATQTVVWNAEGHTEGARSFDTPFMGQTVLNVGINYNSFIGGYPSNTPPVTWWSDGYIKTLFGSAHTIT
jgi:hypothetical protein